MCKIACKMQYLKNGFQFNVSADLISLTNPTPTDVKLGLKWPRPVFLFISFPILLIRMRINKSYMFDNKIFFLEATHFQIVRHKLDFFKNKCDVINCHGQCYQKISLNSYQRCQVLKKIIIRFSQSDWTTHIRFFPKSVLPPFCY